jgi:hypothetical protein
MASKHGGGSDAKIVEVQHQLDETKALLQKNVYAKRVQKNMAQLFPVLAFHAAP